MTAHALVRRLRSAGCVFAEQEARALRRASADPDELERLTRRREHGEPLEQVVGSVAFAGLRLAVGPGVFVPRQRSLLLARLAVARVRGQRDPVLLEACAGVAPLAAAVAHRLPGLRVHASDVDEAALRFARLNLPPGAGTSQGHLLEATPAGLRGQVTLLVAVPPYVPLHAADLLPREAREHEPARALFGGSDGLDVVRELLDTADPWLAPAGRVLLELHAGQCPAAALHADDSGWTSRAHHSPDGQTAVLELTRAGAGRVSDARGQYSSSAPESTSATARCDCRTMPGLVSQ